MKGEYKFNQRSICPKVKRTLIPGLIEGPVFFIDDLRNVVLANE
jgi:hypothetical protein